MAIGFSLGTPMGRLSAQDMGVPDYQKALQSGYQSASMQQELANKPQRLSEQLLGQMLTNRINRTRADYAQPMAEMALQQGQGELGMLPYKQQLLQAQIKNAGASADKTAMVQKMMGQILSGNQAQEQQPSQGMIDEEGRPVSSVAQSRGMNYPQSALMSHMLGLGQPKIIDVNGKKLAVTPFGNIEVAQGQTEFQKKMSAQDAKNLGEIEKSYSNAQDTQSTLDGLVQIISSPDFEAMRQHPIAGSYELKAYSQFGTPKQQELANAYMTYTGDIIRKAARDFKGQFRVGEQLLLNSMKPSLSDTIDGAKAKTEALSKMNKMLMLRSQITSELMREKGLSPVKAAEIAERQINGKEISRKIYESLHKSGVNAKISNAIKSKKELTFNPSTGRIE